ncbi:50S ribosomal protein L3 [Candidatus Micrarchaeota archaeon]|nr:50S ribosomal protein L3 [Candidatus Micrarchaeota archaeon]
MAKRSAHRRGSLAFWPRKRASTQMPRIGSWAHVTDPILLGFAGYKVGMTHLTMVDDSTSPSKGQEISVPVTVLEVPPLTVFAIRAYTKGYVDKKTFTDAITNDEKILKHLGLPKNDGLKKIESSLSPISDLTLLAFASPSKTGIGKKKPEIMELGVGGKTKEDKLNLCKGLLGKEVKVKDVFKEGEFVDATSVTKGKGWQGPVKRFGVATQRRKSTGKVRHVGTLGPWHPSRVMYTVPQAGQMGYHKRTELNKRILKIGENATEINVKGGFLSYGLVKNDYLLIKGSIGGPSKRLIRLRKAARIRDSPKKPSISYISKESNQGA